MEKVSMSIQEFKELPLQVKILFGVVVAFGIIAPMINCFIAILMGL